MNINITEPKGPEQKIKTSLSEQANIETGTNLKR